MMPPEHNFAKIVQLHAQLFKNVEVDDNMRKDDNMRTRDLFF